jgi:hypothetical protein
MPLAKRPSKPHSPPWFFAVLDGAALLLSTLDVPWNPQAALSIRAGYLALREIATFFGIPCHPEPTYPEQSISITREEFEAACDELALSFDGRACPALYLPLGGGGVRA